MQKKFDPKVFQLGYVALGTPEIERTKDHYLQILGMTEVSRGEDGSVYLSIGYNHHDLVLRPAKQKALLHLGFHLKPHISVHDLAGEARELGLAATVKTDIQPCIRELVEVEAPGGLMIQFYSAMEAFPAPGFKQTGASPMRLGHVAVISPEGDKLIAFFKDFLGFWFTDDIAGIANFLTCNREHHVVNVVKAPESRVHHIAFELRESSCHTIAADALRAAGIKLLWGPSRHTAGHNLASYHHDPDKVMIEFYTDMDTFIPELGMCEPRPWHEHLPMTPRSWGPNEVNTWGLEFGFNLAAG
jgi:catechol-2,3-dioxygenase